MEEAILKTLIPKIKLGKTFSADIEIMHTGKWEHPQYGTIKIDNSDIDKFVNSFDNNVRKVDLAIDQEHMPEKGAAGWIKSLKKEEDDNGMALMASIEWTKLGKGLIKDGVFKYFSPELAFDYEDQETHENFENVLIGGALTNRPYFKNLAPVALSENMYAGFKNTKLKSKEKGGEKRMNEKELKAKLVEDIDYKLPEDASKADKKLFKEVKSILAKEAEDKKKGEIKGSEKFISAAEHTKQMNEVRSQMGIVEKKLRFKEVQEQVSGFIFSESNLKGVLLAKNEDAAVKLLMAATPKVAQLFSEFMKDLPVVSSKLLTEQGGTEGEGNTFSSIDKEAQKMMEKGTAETYGEAIKILQNTKPNLFEGK